MPVINIYLSQELFDYVKSDKSRIIQNALNYYMAQQLAPKRCSTDEAINLIEEIPESVSEKSG